MTLREYLNKVFEHTTKTIETENEKRRLHREFLKSKEDYIEQGFIPDEAEDKVLETLPTPDEYREKLNLDVNRMSDTDKSFAVFRWVVKGALIVALILFVVRSVQYPTDVYYYFTEIMAFQRSSLLMIYVSWSLLLNTFAIFFLMNKPDSSYGEKVRKTSLVIIGMLTHPFGIPVLIVGLLFTYPRMQKAEYFKKRLFNFLKVKKHPVAVYTGTFVAFLIIALGGFTLARGLFTTQSELPNQKNIYFENNEDGRIIQSGIAKLIPIDEETTEVKLLLNQYSFATSTPTELENARLSYKFFDIEGLSEPIEFNKYLELEDTIVVNQTIEDIINNFEMKFTVYYKDDTDTENVKVFSLTQDDISSVNIANRDESFWIWE